MKKLLLAFGAGLMMVSCNTAEITQTVGTILTETTGAKGLSTADVVSGLKEALVLGTNKGTSLVSAKDGFLKNAAIKVLFPPEVQKVQTKLNDIGLGHLSDNLVNKMNSAAEDATKSAAPIFVNAIKSMTVTDAWDILKGEKNAATNYLKKTTSTQLFDAFSPVVNNSLDKVKVLDAWGDVTKAYNTATLFTGGDKVDTDIKSYVTNKAIDGVFHMIAKQELEIRKDPTKRATDLLKKVFAQQD